MLADLPILIIVALLSFFSFLGGLAKIAIPPWLNQGISDIFAGSTGWLNSILPMYPHPGMSGLAGQIGIMTIFGFVLFLAGVMVIVMIAYWLFKLILSLFPWSTHAVKSPGNKG